eukprot:gene32921-40371_t
MRAAAVLLSAAAADAATHAVLVASSNGWTNYSELLTSGGVPPSNIIMMMWDDVAHNPHNPFPGKLFSEPNGPDVYANVTIDYRSHDVTSANFLSDDDVFVYIADHGAPGLIHFPRLYPVDYLYKDDLMHATQVMYNRSMYSKLTFYVEACQSGSMFSMWGCSGNCTGCQGCTPLAPAAYAVTSAPMTALSYPSNCGTHVNGRRMAKPTCLSDVFSMTWMREAELPVGRRDVGGAAPYTVRDAALAAAYAAYDAADTVAARDAAAAE